MGQLASLLLGWMGVLLPTGDAPDPGLHSTTQPANQPHTWLHRQAVSPHLHALLHGQQGAGLRNLLDAAQRRQRGLEVRGGGRGTAHREAEKDGAIKQQLVHLCGKQAHKCSGKKAKLDEEGGSPHLERLLGVALRQQQARHGAKVRLDLRLHAIQAVHDLERRRASDWEEE